MPDRGLRLRLGGASPAGRLGPFVREFGRLVRHIPLREADTQVVAFVSGRLPRNAASFEALMRKDVDPGFAVREPAPGGVAASAGSSARTSRLLRWSRLQYSGSILGLDLAAIPGCVTAIEHAISSGKMTASAAVDLPLSASGHLVVWNFMAAYRGADTSGAPSSRTGLLGVCAMAFRVDQLVELSLKELSPAGIDLELLDADAPAGPAGICTITVQGCPGTFHRAS